MRAPWWFKKWIFCNHCQVPVLAEQLVLVEPTSTIKYWEKLSRKSPNCILPWVCQTCAPRSSDYGQPRITGRNSFPTCRIAVVHPRVGPSS